MTQFITNVLNGFSDKNVIFYANDYIVVFWYVKAKYHWDTIISFCSKNPPEKRIWSVLSHLCSYNDFKQYNFYCSDTALITVSMI